MSKSMLAKEQEVDVEVTLEDQKRINKFGKLNNQLHEMVDEITEEGKNLDNAKDAVTELDEFTLEFDDEPVYYKFGDCFFELTGDEAKERVEAEVERVEGVLGEKKQKHEGIVSEINELKQALYGKFGSSINLEED
eukprot:CAMPEP_0113898570 /NCGR_PEP_ID=MMETSP0780_2-20120614/19471_1 /TAXON_ID=652834 /ORGANISM="Palpitomonas bilix" /LENGTH=135 /DNA_ID=CAMNT_0000890485 /DNA_START=82 /DNA_END=489 /DNA_ORIENTATION=+ /assembly_acc=CAM_ASM_000599